MSESATSVVLISSVSLKTTPVAFVSPLLKIVTVYSKISPGLAIPFLSISIINSKIWLILRVVKTYPTPRCVFSGDLRSLNFLRLSNTLLKRSLPFSTLYCSLVDASMDILIQLKLHTISEKSRTPLLISPMLKPILEPCLTIS